MQKYHDEPRQYKGYLKNALTAPDKVNLLLLAREVGRSQLAWSRRWLRRSVRSGSDDKTTD